MIAKPSSGVAVAPTAGDEIGAFWATVGFAKATILSVTDAGTSWGVTVSEWSPRPTESAAVAGTPIVPWNAQLTLLATKPVDGELGLAGAVPEYFAGLGPGEMTTLTADDISRRRRWPKIGDTNPLTGAAEWPTDITGRLASAILRATDAIDVNVLVVGSVTTPTVPNPAFIGTPPSVLTLSKLHVLPML